MKRFVLADGAKEEINKIFEKARVTKREVAGLLDVTPITFYYKTCGKRSSFSAREVEKLLDAFPEISKAFFKPYKYGDHVNKCGDHVTAKSITPIEVKRISNGYEAQFTGVDGKLHSAYGKTELEARKKAEERMASITVKQEKVPDDKAGINISGDEAMVLLNQLMLDLRNGAVSEADKPILKSIYMRLAVQII
jgi:hypothetical protein|uniref:HTH-type transcriptional regulator n=1 Tax=Myoviridae sp. ctAca11 TaxID=2825043 RepID=A0A8S5Q7A9_9CAUD|nr:MAG TPA: HTH-type transcriptional regulator [Myoviridae sp. ctAca11]